MNTNSATRLVHRSEVKIYVNEAILLKSGLVSEVEELNEFTRQFVVGNSVLEETYKRRSYEVITPDGTVYLYTSTAADWAGYASYYLKDFSSETINTDALSLIKFFDEKKIPYELKFHC